MDVCYGEDMVIVTVPNPSLPAVSTTQSQPASTWLPDLRWRHGNCLQDVAPHCRPVFL